MTIKKTKNDYDTFDIELRQDNKVLEVCQTGENINFSCRFANYCEISAIDFNISSSEEDLYLIFNKLYNNIINGNLLDEDINLPKVKERMELAKCMSCYETLVDDEMITILSDAYPISCPNILKIRKKDEKIILSFMKLDGDLPKASYYIPVNIRQSGSRIYDFCVPFKKCFRELQKVDEKENRVKLLKNN